MPKEAVVGLALITIGLVLIMRGLGNMQGPDPWPVGDGGPTMPKTGPAVPIAKPNPEASRMGGSE